MNYALITVNPFTVLKEYDAIPEPLVWPNGDATHGVSPGHQYLEWQLVPVSISPKPNEFYDFARPYSMSFDGTTLTASPKLVAQDLAAVKSLLADRVDAAAEILRQKTITCGSGQAMVYLQKQTEAQKCLADPSPDPVYYPLLAATIGLEGETVGDVAKLVINIATEWTTKAAQIERARLFAKAAIAAAYSVDEADKAHKNIVWP